MSHNPGAHPRMDPAVRGENEIRLLTNSMPVDIDERSVVYRYNVTIKLTNKEKKELCVLSKRSSRESASVSRRVVNRRLLYATLQKKLSFEFYKITHLAYDGYSTLLSTDALKKFTFTITCSELNDDLKTKGRFSDDCSLVIQMTAMEGDLQHLLLKEYGLGSPSDARAQAILQSLEILLNQHMYESGSYLVFGRKAYEWEKPEVVERGFLRRQGVCKGVRVVEGKRGGAPRVVYTIDAKVGIFYPDCMSLWSALCLFMGWTDKQGQVDGNLADWNKDACEQCCDYVRDLDLEYLDKTGMIVPITATRLSDRPPGDISITDGKNDQSVKLSESSWWKSDLPSSWRCIVVMDRGVTKYYEMDRLRIALFQRLPFEKKLIPVPVAMSPSERLRKIDKHAEHMMVCESRWLQDFGVRVKRRIGTPALRRPHSDVSVHYAGATPPIDRIKCSWRMGRFISPANISCWVLVYDDPAKKRVVESFISFLRESARAKGMQLSDPGLIVARPLNKPVSPFVEEMACLLNGEWAKRGEGGDGRLPFLFYIDHSTKKEGHRALKYAEALHQVITQHVTMDLIERVVAKRSNVTMENIVSKMNEKQTDGHCYNVMPGPHGIECWFDGSRLFVGLDVAHPPSQSKADFHANKPCTEPSTVGLSYNGAPTLEQKFVGDWCYQQPRVERIEERVLSVWMHRMLDRFSQLHGRPPSEIVVLRDGVSDAQLEHVVLNGELVCMSSVCAEWAELRQYPDYHPLWLVIVCTKRHNKRFFVPTSKEDTVENILPLTVVDTTMVAPYTTQFFMQTARPLLGTAKAAEYFVLRNDSHHSMDAVQAMLTALAFSHQICSSPVGIPVPVFLADEYAKRGATMWKEMAVRRGLLSIEEVRLEDATEDLANGVRPLSNTRSNA